MTDDDLALLDTNWPVFCQLWAMYGTVIAIRNATPEERADPELLARLVCTLAARCLTLEIMVGRLTVAVHQAFDDIERIERHPWIGRRA